MAEYIEHIPSWEQVLPILLATIESGTEECRSSARCELERMAKAADRYNASLKRPE